LNEQLTEEEYKKRISAIDFTDSDVVEDWRAEAQHLWKKAFRCGAVLTNSEDALGEDIHNSRDVFGSVIWESEHAYKAMLTAGVKNSYDTQGGHGVEYCYNDLLSIPGYGNRMTNMCWSCMDLEYSELCTSCEHCFGCLGLTHKSFCIFNKQYTEEEYWKRVDAMKVAMLERGEYGEFFSHALNPVAYNSSHAMALFPMVEEEAKKLGMRWYSFAEEQKGEAESASAIPEKLVDTKDAILKQAFRCPITNRIFRFVKPELEFHREMNLALPRVHPSVRRYGRAAQQFPLYLNQRPCDSCQTIMWTRIPATHTAPVLCQDCYEKVVIGEKELPVAQ
jgi:hypothetical protein